MSKNNNQEVITVEERARLDATKLFLVIFACVALVGIIASIIIGIVAGGSRNINYMKKNLSKYVYVSEDLYNSYDVTVDLPGVTDIDVEDEIIKVLAKNKIVPDGVVPNLPYVTLSAGDVANIYYRGYTLNEDDSKNYFNGGSNFGSTIANLELGSGSFIPGFESGLIGKNQKDYATLTTLTEGNVQSGDIIKFTYSSYYADGTARMAQTATIDLGDPKTDEAWGKGFVEYFKNNTPVIGEKFGTNEDSANKIIVDTTRESKDGATTDVYFDMTISEVYRVSEGERLVVKAYFPVDYSEATLKGKTAYFEVYIKTAKDYETPELNEEFITGTLKLTADDLASYDGETIVDKYKSYVKAGLVEAYNEKVDAIVEEAFWDHVIAGANFKKLPESEIEKKYNDNIEEINNTYANGYSSYYSSVDQFARAYLGLDSTADWKKTVRENSESAIKQKIVFYYILRHENLVPKGEDYDKIYDVIFEEHVQSYLDYSLEQGVNVTAEAAKAEIEAQFADSYWFELVAYDYLMDKMIDNAKVTHKNNDQK